MVRQRDEEFDVIVLGSGIAGLSTALAAQRQGLKTLLLENQAKLGGGTTHSWGLTPPCVYVSPAKKLATPGGETTRTSGFQCHP